MNDELSFLSNLDKMATFKLFGDMEVNYIKIDYRQRPNLKNYFNIFCNHKEIKSQCKVPEKITSLYADEHKIVINNSLTLEGRKLTYKGKVCDFSPYEYNFEEINGVISGYRSIITLHDIPEELSQDFMNWSEQDAFYYALQS